MNDRIAHADIPQEARDLVDEIYTPEGGEIWWNSRNQLFDDQRPRDIWLTKDGRETVLALLDALGDGVIM